MDTTVENKVKHTPEEWCIGKSVKGEEYDITEYDGGDTIINFSWKDQKKSR